MSDLKENKILLKGFLLVFVPLVIFGLFSAFFPVMYALFPVQQSEYCLCTFFERKVVHDKHYIIDLD